MDYKDLISLCETNKRLNELICQDPEERVWKNLFRNIISELRFPRNNYKNVYQRAIKRAYAFHPNSALRVAAMHGSEKLIKTLIAIGANEYNLALVIVASCGCKDIVEYMVKMGASDYNEAIFAATRYKHYDIIRLLESLSRKRKR